MTREIDDALLAHLEKSYGRIVQIIPLPTNGDSDIYFVRQPGTVFLLAISKDGRFCMRISR